MGRMDGSQPRAGALTAGPVWPGLARPEVAGSRPLGRPPSGPTPYPVCIARSVLFAFPLRLAIYPPGLHGRHGAARPRVVPQPAHFETRALTRGQVTWSATSGAGRGTSSSLSLAARPLALSPRPRRLARLGAANKAPLIRPLSALS